MVLIATDFAPSMAFFNLTRSTALPFTYMLQCFMFHEWESKFIRRHKEFHFKSVITKSSRYTKRILSRYRRYARKVIECKMNIFQMFFNNKNTFQSKFNSCELYSKHCVPIRHQKLFRNRLRLTLWKEIYPWTMQTLLIICLNQQKYITKSEYEYKTKLNRTHRNETQ